MFEGSGLFCRRRFSGDLQAKDGTWIWSWRRCSSHVQRVIHVGNKRAVIQKKKRGEVGPVAGRAPQGDDR